MNIHELFAAAEAVAPEFNLTIVAVNSDKTKVKFQDHNGRESTVTVKWLRENAIVNPEGTAFKLPPRKNDDF